MTILIFFEPKERSQLIKSKNAILCQLVSGHSGDARPVKWMGDLLNSA